MSCKKAQKYFGDNAIELGEKSDARKEKIDENNAWKIISQFDTVHIGKGKKTLTFTPSPENKKEILKAAMGRSGNLRAPTIKTSEAIIIGYNEDMYSQL